MWVLFVRRTTNTTPTYNCSKEIQHNSPPISLLPLFGFLNHLGKSLDVAQEVLVVGGAEAGHGTPAIPCAIAIGAHGADGALVVARVDAVEGGRVGSGSLVEKRVEEAQRLLAVVEPEVVQQGDDARNDRGGCGGTSSH